MPHQTRSIFPGQRLYSRYDFQRTYVERTSVRNLLTNLYTIRDDFLHFLDCPAASYLSRGRACERFTLLLKVLLAEVYRRLWKTGTFSILFPIAVRIGSEYCIWSTQFFFFPFFKLVCVSVVRGV